MAALGTRIVKKVCEAGMGGDCALCGERIHFVAKKRTSMLLANVYGRNGDPAVWDRVEYWHTDCYERAGSPYGNPTSVDHLKWQSRLENRGKKEQRVA